MKILRLSFVLLLFLGCSSFFKKTYDSNLVLVTVAPYMEFIEKIAGDTVRVHVLIPPGVNAHFFEPTPKQMEDASKARLWIRIGDPIENKISNTLKEHRPNLTELKLWEYVPLLPLSDPTTIDVGCHMGSDHHHHGSLDVHYWLSPKLAKLQAQAIAEALINLFPEHRSFYEKNLALFLKELSEIDQQITDLLAPDKGKTILVSHPAFGYFCKDYGLYQLSVECEGKEPKPKAVQRILELAKERQVSLVIAQKGYNNKGAEQIAKELALSVYFIDPYSKHYVKTLLNLAELIISHDHRS